ncbi:MAG TPA: inorganic phosphate transporter [Polyangiaceae bacterium]|jgi:PiT family inorganic phosphate transporter
MSPLLPLLALIALALAFDVLNGFHDAANSIATVVSTRVLSPRWAVAWAAFFNFIAFLVFGTRVAANIAKGVDPHVLSLGLIAAALVGAILWDLLTWWLGLPTSSSHALIGGLAGAAIVKAGPHAIDVSFFLLTASFIVLSPLIGGVLGFLIMTLVMRLAGDKPYASVDHIFRRLQLLSAAGYSLGHGGNDAQKTMGIIVAALLATGHLGGQGAHPKVPLWVVLACHAAMAAGTFLGGWRIVRTMGTKLSKLTPPDGFSAEAAGTITLLMDTLLGIPVSTTHTIAGGIVGVASARRARQIHWRTAQRIGWAWAATIPGAGIVGGCALFALQTAGVAV